MSNIFNQLCLRGWQKWQRLWAASNCQLFRSFTWVSVDKTSFFHLLWQNKFFSFCYDNNMHLAQFAWFCKPANNSCGHLTVVLPDKWTIWSTILNLIQEGMRNGTVGVLWCQASRLMLVFLDEHLNRAYKINQEKDLLCQNFSWADKGLAQSENCLLACSFIGKSSQRYSKANQT